MSQHRSRPLLLAQRWLSLASPSLQAGDGGGGEQGDLLSPSLTSTLPGTRPASQALQPLNEDQILSLLTIFFFFLAILVEAVFIETDCLVYRGASTSRSAAHCTTKNLCDRLCADRRGADLCHGSGRRGGLGLRDDWGGDGLRPGCVPSSRGTRAST